MGPAIRTPATPRATPRLPMHRAGPLESIIMSDHERRQAEQNMRVAEQIVDVAFEAIAAIRAVARRLRSATLVRATH